MNRCNYVIQTLPGFICLTDLDQGKSLTNDAENVIADLKRAGYDLRNNRVIYRDTQGVWDELVLRDGEFSTFRSLHALDVHSAITAAKAVP